MKKRTLATTVIGMILLSGWLVPDQPTIPVLGATPADWHPNSFWYEPWGASGVHKGIDIFAAKGTPVIASTHLVVLFRGSLARGGKVVLGLGRGWRVHYFAHLDQFAASAGVVVPAGTVLGTVGDSGNAQGKPPHLHFSLLDLLPAPWRIDGATQGYKKAFYANPAKYLTHLQP